MVAIDRQFGEFLLSQSDYRDFIKAFLTESHAPTPLSYAELSRRAGFSSRSFPRDVVRGDKRLTVRSIAKMAKGLGLKSRWRDYFFCLVSLRENELNQESLPPWSLEDRLAHFRSQLRQQLEADSKKVSRQEVKNVYQIYRVAQIYAALGVPFVGATIEDISTRTGLDETSLRKSLKHMLDLEMVECRNDRYIARVTHKVYQQLGDSRYVQDHVMREAYRMRHACKEGFGTDENLFMHSAVSIKKSQMVEFKARLRQLVMDFTDQVESPEGDSIVNIQCSMYSERT